MSLIPWWMKLIALAALAGALAWGIHLYDKGISDKQRAADVAEYNVKLLAAQTKAAEDTARLTKEKDDAIAQATEQLKARDAAVAKLTTTNAGLRNTVSNLRSSLSTVSLDACRARAEALAGVFGECTDRLRAMGQAAQGQFIDSMMYQEAWPK